MYDFEQAKDKVLMGVERKSLVISAKEKEMTAYHEMGHALVRYFIPNADKVHKVTIIPRGRALGVTTFLPNEDQHSLTKDYIETQIITLLAGRAAEKIVFGNLTTGAANDLQRATHLARKWCATGGMSEEIGPITFAHQHEEVF
jgi:cell division protease FtsH